MTPYPEGQNQTDENKCLFTTRLCAARVEQTENIYGMLKRRFPMVKYIRTSLTNSIGLIQVAAVLHNISIDRNDPVPTRPHPNYRDLNHDPNYHEYIWEATGESLVIINELNPAERRAQGMLARENWRNQMDPTPTDRERRRMRAHLEGALNRRDRRNR